jgi:hypothetical protein
MLDALISFYLVVAAIHSIVVRAARSSRIESELKRSSNLWENTRSWNLASGGTGCPAKISDGQQLALRREITARRHHRGVSAQPDHAQQLGFRSLGQQRLVAAKKL